MLWTNKQMKFYISKLLPFLAVFALASSEICNCYIT
jgi:hypothetical protein